MFTKSTNTNPVYIYIVKYLCRFPTGNKELYLTVYGNKTDIYSTSMNNIKELILEQDELVDIHAVNIEIIDSKRIGVYRSALPINSYEIKLLCKQRDSEPLNMLPREFHSYITHTVTVQAVSTTQAKVFAKRILGFKGISESHFDILFDILSIK